VNVFRDGDRFVFALTYGSASDWVQNVLAAGRCELETRGRTYRLVEPRLFTDPSRRAVPSFVRVPLGLPSVDEFLTAKKISPRESEDLRELSAGSDDSEELPDPTGGT
jgi:hypothetical protein